MIEFPEEQPLVMTSTVKLPEVETVILCVVSPVDHKLSVAEDEVNTTEPPEQNVVAPPAGNCRNRRQWIYRYTNCRRSSRT